MKLFSARPKAAPVAEPKKEPTVKIDPVAMNIVNRIAPGTVSKGDLSFEGGLLLQGHHEGTLRMSGGPLVIEGGSIDGHGEVHGDAWVFGRVGRAGAPEGEHSLTVHGTLHLTGRAETHAVLRAQKFAHYGVPRVSGRTETIPAPDGEVD